MLLLGFIPLPYARATLFSTVGTWRHPLGMRSYEECGGCFLRVSQIHTKSPDHNLIWEIALHSNTPCAGWTFIAMPNRRSQGKVAAASGHAFDVEAFAVGVSCRCPKCLSVVAFRQIGFH